MSGMRWPLMLLLVSSIVASARAADEIKEEWSEMDLRGIAALAHLMPLEGQDVPGLLRSWKEDSEKANWSCQEQDLGFGAKLFRVRQGWGYAYTNISIVFFDNHLATYVVSVMGNAEIWTARSGRYLDAWQRNGGPKPTGHEQYYRSGDEQYFHYTCAIAAVDKAFHAAVSAELGDLKPVDVPDRYKEAYDSFISPTYDMRINDETVAEAGAFSEESLVLEDLIQSGHLDVVENVLRGYNVCGRVYAALALLKAKSQGLALSAKTGSTIDQVARLQIPVSTPAGGTVDKGEKAQGIIEKYQKVWPKAGTGQAKTAGAPGITP